MKYPIILQSVLNIEKRLKNYSLGQSTKAHYYFDTLNRQEKNTYVDDYEKFWYLFNIVFEILSDLKLSAQSLYDILYRRDLAVQNHTRDIWLKTVGPELKRIRYHNKNFYNTICILILFIIENQLITNDDFKLQYPELQYARLLRNDFVQHQKLNYSFSIISSSSIPGGSNYLPYTQIGPGGGGFAFLTGYYALKIQDRGFLNLKPREQLLKNKSDFINIGGWKSIYRGNNDDLLFRIKSCGLPKIDQIKIANELDLIFDKIIFPHFDIYVVQARNNNVLF